MNITDKIAFGSLLATIIIGISNFLYTNHIDKSRRKKEKVLYNKQERLEANILFEKVRNKKELFEDAIGDLLSSNDSNERFKLFQKTITRYSALYNEIEDFSNIIIDKAVQSEQYIRKIVLPELEKLAYIQIESFTTLNDFAKVNKFSSLIRPNYKAFEGYDTLLKMHYGEDSLFWKDLTKRRKESGMI